MLKTLYYIYIDIGARFHKRNLLSPNHFVVRVVLGYSFTLGVYRVVGGFVPGVDGNPTTREMGPKACPGTRQTPILSSEATFSVPCSGAPESKGGFDLRPVVIRSIDNNTFVETTKFDSPSTNRLATVIQRT